MFVYAANLTVTTSAVSRNRSASASTASAIVAALGADSGLLDVLKGIKAEQALSTAPSTPTTIPAADSNLVVINQGAMNFGEARLPMSILACTQYFLFPEDGPNSFVYQGDDGTWNHLFEEDTYSLCPSQVTTVSMIIIVT